MNFRCFLVVLLIMKGIKKLNQIIFLWAHTDPTCTSQSSSSGPSFYPGRNGVYYFISDPIYRTQNSDPLC